jgi:hypothetical protein
VRQFGNGVAQSLGYDTVGRVGAITDAGLGLGYTYSHAGDVRRLADTRAPNDTSFTQAMRYDAMGRLVRAVGKWGTVERTYDAAGNGTTVGSTFDYTGGQNRLMRTVIGQVERRYVYDANGALAQERQRPGVGQLRVHPRNWPCAAQAFRARLAQFPDDLSSHGRRMGGLRQLRASPDPGGEGPMKTRRKLRQESFASAVGRALRRAGAAARRTARMHGTPVYIWRNGKVVAEKP